MTKSRIIQLMRKAADLLEQSSLPETSDGYRSYYGSVNVPCRDAAELAEFARTFGKCDKRAHDELFWLSAKLDDSGLFHVDANADRAAVCRKIITTKTLPAEPEKTIPAQPERTVEEVSWDCGSILAAADHDNQANESAEEPAKAVQS